MLRHLKNRADLEDERDSLREELVEMKDLERDVD